MDNEKEEIEVNSAEYWDKKYERLSKNGHLRRDIPAFKLITSKIKDGDKVLDIGCGQGEFLEYVEQTRPEAILYGSDHSIVAMRETLKRVNDCAWYNDVSVLPDNYFDVITCLHTMEHFKKPEELVNELKRLLKPDGILVISLPFEDRPYKEHYRVWTKENITAFFKQWSCDIAAITRVGTNMDRFANIIQRRYGDTNKVVKEAILFIKFKYGNTV